MPAQILHQIYTFSSPVVVPIKIINPMTLLKATHHIIVYQYFPKLLYTHSSFLYALDYSLLTLFTRANLAQDIGWHIAGKCVEIISTIFIAIPHDICDSIAHHFGRHILNVLICDNLL